MKEFSIFENHGTYQNWFLDILEPWSLALITARGMFLFFITAQHQ
jgi:hypothetical protein